MALMWALEMIRKFRPESGRILADAWATGKAMVWMLEMVREYMPMSGRL